MIWIIAKKELTEMLRDGRFRWVSAAVLALLLGAALMGARHYGDVRSQHEMAREGAREHWLGQGEKNPHSAAHYGTYAFKPTMSLSALDPGVDPYVGVSVWLEAHRQNQFEYRPAQDSTAVQRFGQLTAASVMQLLIPLLIILLAFSALAAEREQGTLRQLMSHGIQPGQLATGKALGVAAALGLVLVPAALLGVIALALTGSSELVAADAPRLAMMALAYVVYFAVFVGASLAVSAKAPSSRLALVALLGFWILNGLVAPRLVTDLARAAYPSPSSFEFTTGMQNALANGLDGESPLEERYAQFEREILAEYDADNVQELPVNYGGLRLQKSEEWGDAVFDHFYGQLYSTFEKQNRVRQISSLAAPLLALQSLSMGLAGTDFAQHRDFIDSAETYRRRLVKQMNDDLAFNGAEAGFAYRADAELWASVPDFDYQAPALGWVLGNHGWSAAILLLWLAVAVIAGFRAARTIQPI